MYNVPLKCQYALFFLLLVAVNVTICIAIQASHRDNTPINSTLTLPDNHIKQSQSQSRPLSIDLTVQPGDTLSSLLHNQNIDSKDMQRLFANHKILTKLSQLRIGDHLHLTLNHHLLLKLSHTLPDNKELNIIKHNNEFVTQTTTLPLISSTRYASAIIHTSLAAAAETQHIPAQILHQLEYIFKGTVNFSTQIRPNDKVEILYNEYFKNGLPYKPGEILLAELHLSHKTHGAVLFSFDHKHGYYTLSGHSVEPLFLRFPLHFKRISSRFSLHRLDPITHKIQPHFGVDLAAPTGTPIHSVGNGTIVFKGWETGYGNTIKIRYDKKYVALYAHMTRFAKVKRNEHVKKGQTIGYVGMTGWATGPHLHFGWYVNHVPVDPLKRKIMYNPPIPTFLRHAFTTTKNRLLTELTLFQSHQTHSSRA